MKKPFSKTFIALVLLTGLIGLNSTIFGVVYASTEVSGVISSDTTWTLENSPYVVTAPLLVDIGATLTIEPGVIVHIDTTYIRIQGTLIARGNITHPISIITNATTGLQFPTQDNAIQFTDESTDWDEQTGSGSIIEGAFISTTRYSDLITIDRSSPKIRNCTLVNDNYGYVISIYSESTAIISNCSITSKSGGIYCGGTFVDTNVPRILHNVIENCSNAGIYVDGGSPIIERNYITNSTFVGGILVTYPGADPSIRNNTITGNNVGIKLEISPTQPILYNNIYDNTEYNIYLQVGASEDINATNNWWGTINTSGISQTIYDFKNDFNLGTVNFDPFLLEENQQTTPDESIPELTSAGLLLLLLTATSIIALCRQKIFKTTHKTQHV
ncbi:MAG: right-handed parallel beta-helix repeat-containing protein [Candidatus Bathyarchaeota archaeon]|nr:right-handed parallel beta-helix repeat-containing protein [Candidatus Bathyarchaeota archaeon]